MFLVGLKGLENQGQMELASVREESRPNTPDTPIVDLIVERLELAPSHTSKDVLNPKR